jgi:hypothetical protein
MRIGAYSGEGEQRQHKCREDAAEGHEITYRERRGEYGEMECEMVEHIEREPKLRKARRSKKSSEQQDAQYAAQTTTALPPPFCLTWLRNRRAGHVLIFVSGHAVSCG